MSELHSFLDSAIADIRSRLEQEYQRRLTAHEAAIGEDLCPTDFTPNHGKITVDVELLRKLNLYSHEEQHKFHRVLSSIVPAGHWAVHAINDVKSIRHGTVSSQGSSTDGVFSIIDNHGEWYSYTYSGCYMSGESHIYFKERTAPTKTYPYRMPDVLIDFCKMLKEPIDVGPLVEHYYKQFVRVKPLFVSGKLVEYTILQEEKATVEKELEKTRAELTASTERYEKLCGMIGLLSIVFKNEYLSSLQAIYDKRSEEINAIYNLCSDDKLVSPEINCIHMTTRVIRELTESKKEQQAQMKELREIIIANEQQIRDLKKKTADTQTQLSNTKKEVATVTEQAKQLREENQRYVDIAFQQRHEIIKYKKELLRLDPAMSFES
jgi:hypothetical protein